MAHPDSLAAGACPDGGAPTAGGAPPMVVAARASVGGSFSSCFGCSSSYLTASIKEGPRGGWHAGLRLEVLSVVWTHALEPTAAQNDSPGGVPLPPPPCQRRLLSAVAATAPLWHPGRGRETDEADRSYQTDPAPARSSATATMAPAPAFVSASFLSTGATLRRETTSTLSRVRQHGLSGWARSRGALWRAICLAVLFLALPPARRAHGAESD